MSDRMTHWERVRAALEGADVDRVPISVWRHFYSQERSAQGLADSMLAFQRAYDWDFMKVNPRASYHMEDWGLGLRFSDSDDTPHETVEWPIERAADWASIEHLDIHSGVLGEHLEALDLIAKGLDGQVPYLMTVFNPLSIAASLAGSEEAMVEHMGEHPAEVHGALEVITDVFSRYAAECLEVGASGIFFATTRWGTYDRLTEDEYSEFGRPYDLKVLDAVASAELNVLHVCGSNNMLPLLADYPVEAFNWDAQDDTNVWLTEGAKVTGKPVIGGLPHRTMLLDGAPDEVAAEAAWTADLTGRSGWMLAPGCTIPPTVPEPNLNALRGSLSRPG